MSKLCRKGLLMIMIIILRHLNLHIPKICGKICRMHRIFLQIPHIFPHILPPSVLHILRKFCAINQHSYYVGIARNWSHKGRTSPQGRKIKAESRVQR